MTPRQRVLARIGHRGVVCALLGLIWCFIALGLVVAPPRHVGLIYEQIPMPIRVLLWGIPGLVGIGAGFLRPLREHAWWVLIIPPAERAASFAWAWLASVIGWGPVVPNAWLGLGIYGALCVLVYECAAGLDRPLNAGEPEWQPTK